jgi:heat-inducible transcriptional repressor
MILTERQRTILNAVTERYIGTGMPISSKELAGSVGLQVSSSTVRNEFALLEERGYLSHPHTSAGRVPTDLGYREFVDCLMSGTVCRRPVRSGVAETMLSEDLAGEIDIALRHATDAMSKASNLLALVLAPRVSGARLSHVELLALQAHQLMYVFIVSTGAVMKGMIEWPQAIDGGSSPIPSSARGRRPSCRRSRRPSRSW